MSWPTICTEFARGFFNEKDKAPFSCVQNEKRMERKLSSWRQVSPSGPVTVKTCNEKMFAVEDQTVGVGPTMSS
jgi:hypothetical protein